MNYRIVAVKAKNYKYSNTDALKKHTLAQAVNLNVICEFLMIN